MPIQHPDTVSPPAVVSCTPSFVNRPIASPRTVLPPAESTSPFTAAPAPAPFSSIVGALDQPGCVCPSITAGDDTAGSADPSAIDATPAVNWLAYEALRPGRDVPSASMNTTLSSPAGRPACARFAFESAFAFSRHCRSEPWPESLRLTTTSQL